MQVVGGKQNPLPLLEPGVDFLQERGIDQAAGERVIDTQYDFVPGVLTRLNGRKYVGENTVREMAKLIGLVDADEANQIRAEFEAYKTEVGQAFESLRGITSTIDHVLAQTPSTATDVTPVPDADAIIAQAKARHQAEVDQIAAAEAAASPKEEDVTIKHLTGAERAAIERQAGPLKEVGDRGDLVDVPDELLKAVEGTEEVSGLETAKAVYNRGLGEGERKADEINDAADRTEKDAKAEDKPAAKASTKSKKSDK